MIRGRLYNMLLCSMLGMILFLSPTIVSGEKTDVVILINGDRITGEIKKLDRGKLEYSTDDMGKVYIEWDKINRIWSMDRFEIRLDTGERYIGQIREAPEPEKMVVAAVEESTVIDLIRIVQIDPLE